MLNKLLLVNFIVFSWGCAAKFPPVKIKPAISLQENIKNTVSVYATNQNDELLTSGTGFVINKSGLILTASHNINNAAVAKIWVGVKIANSFIKKEGKLVSLLADCDFALISVDYKFPSQALIRESILETGEYSYTIGYPMNSSDIILAKGEFYMYIFKHRHLSSMNILVEMQLFNFAIAPGASGSPIFDKDGYVVGVISLNAPLRSPYGSMFTWGVPIKYRQLFFQNTRK